MDENSWKAGFKAGRLGHSLDACPDYADSEFWNWYCGFISGRSKPLRLVVEKTDASNAAEISLHDIPAS
jgi:ribosome modulation factor